MPKFVKYADDNNYLMWDEKRMRLVNFNHGHYDIDENDPAWINAAVVDALDWHDLFIKTGYNPLECTYEDRDLWVAPDGHCYDGRAHLICAEKLMKIICGSEDDFAEDRLREDGWIKLTTSFMLEYYIRDGMYNNLTS